MQTPQVKMMYGHTKGSVDFANLLSPIYPQQRFYGKTYSITVEI